MMDDPPDEVPLSAAAERVEAAFKLFVNLDHGVTEVDVLKDSAGGEMPAAYLELVLGYTDEAHRKSREAFKRAAADLLAAVERVGAALTSATERREFYAGMLARYREKFGGAPEARGLIRGLGTLSELYGVRAEGHGAEKHGASRALAEPASRQTPEDRPLILWRGTVTDLGCVLKVVYERYVNEPVVGQRPGPPAIGFSEFCHRVAPLFVRVEGSKVIPMKPDSVRSGAERRTDIKEKRMEEFGREIDEATRET